MRGGARGALQALGLALLFLAPARPQEGPGEGGVRTPEQIGELNPWVLRVLQRYPLDGSCGYYWPRSGGWEGATQDVVYAGKRLASGDPQRRSYCCGLTFEVYVLALLEAAGGPLPQLGPETLHELRLRFFGDSKQGERRRLVQFGLESLGLGKAITRKEDARAGDFVQLWRHDGGGHQAVFINWLWRGGEIVGLTYWSSQPSTRGIGYRSELFGPDGVDPDQVYLARAGWWPAPAGQGEGR